MTNGWALVTGASDGIGAEFCKLLAARGYDLVLTARREPQLRALADELHARHGVRCEVIPLDLAAAGAAAQLHRQVGERGVRVELLINNAGLLDNGYFDEIDLERHQQLLSLNVAALTTVTHLFVRDMLARGSGKILNVASTAAWIGIPQQNVYSASKAYVLSFTLALHDELRAKRAGVSATALCPSYTATKMLDNPAQGKKLSIPAAMILDPTAVARDGIDACLAGRALAIPGLSNRLAMALLQCLPRTWVTRAFGAVYRRQQH